MAVAQVEVFKTDIGTIQLAAQVADRIREHLPACRVTFDLDDCDRIMRVITPEQPINVPVILDIVEQCSMRASVLPD